MMRLLRNDPRTVARDIPGILDAIFPQLSAGSVGYFNHFIVHCEPCEPVSDELISGSSLNRAMLFELAIVAGEQVFLSNKINWDVALDVALKRQRKHFDAELPDAINDWDRQAASQVANNYVAMLNFYRDANSVCFAPTVPGFEWIASSVGDASIGTSLVEVKCGSRKFARADYRQILMYWLLSYASAIEGTGNEWRRAILLNPRRNWMLSISFDELLDVVGTERSKIDVLQIFSALVNQRSDF